MEKGEPARCCLYQVPLDGFVGDDAIEDVSRWSRWSCQFWSENCAGWAWEDDVDEVEGDIVVIEVWKGVDVLEDAVVMHSCHQNEMLEDVEDERFERNGLDDVQVD